MNINNENKFDQKFCCGIKARNFKLPSSKVFLGLGVNKLLFADVIKTWKEMTLQKRRVPA